MFQHFYQFFGDWGLDFDFLLKQAYLAALDIYCTSVHPGRGIPHMWLSLRFLLSFYLLKGFFSSFSLLLLRVKGRGCHTLLKPCETNCGLWIWAIQIQFDWLIDWLFMSLHNLVRIQLHILCLFHLCRYTSSQIHNMSCYVYCFELC